MENNLKIEKAGLYTIAKLQNFGITENQIQDYRVNVIVEMTPEIARELLETNDQNRNVTPHRVTLYAKEMEEGKWETNGETIKIDSNGKLIDGQTRLHAIIKSGLTIPIEISYGMPFSAFTTLDTGKSRTAGDIISIYGTRENANLIAAALKVVIDHENGRTLGGSGGNSNSRISITKGKFVITNQMIQEAFMKHESIVNYLPKRKDTRTIGHRALFAALHYLFAQIDKEKARQFFENLYYGEFTIGDKLYRDSSIKLLREILTDMYAHRDKGNNASNRTIASMTIKVWNAFVCNKTIKRVKIADGEQQQPISGADGKQMKLVV